MVLLPEDFDPTALEGLKDAAFPVQVWADNVDGSQPDTRWACILVNDCDLRKKTTVHTTQGDLLKCVLADCNVTKFGDRAAQQWEK